MDELLDRIRRLERFSLRCANPFTSNAEALEWAQLRGEITDQIEADRLAADRLTPAPAEA